MKRLKFVALTLIVSLSIFNVIPSFAATTSSSQNRKVTIQDVAAGAADIYDLYGPDYVLHIPDSAQTYTYEFGGVWNGIIEDDGIFITEHAQFADAETITVPSFIEIPLEGNDKTVALPVKGVGNGAFTHHSKLTKLVIPEGVERIGVLFVKDNIPPLKELHLPSTAKSFDMLAFYNSRVIDELHISDIKAWCSIDFDNGSANPLNCSRAMYVNGRLFDEIPEGVTEIKPYCFYQCQSLTTLKISSSVKTIGENAFLRCTNLKKVEFSEGLETIGNYAFKTCSYLKISALPSSLKAIGINAFQECVRINEIILGENLERIDNGAFSDCVNLSEVYFKNPKAKIHTYTFGYTQASLPKVTIYGYKDSTAEKTAGQLKLDFVDITTVKLDSQITSSSNSDLDTSSTTDTDIDSLIKDLLNDGNSSKWVSSTINAGLLILILATIPIT